MYTKNKNNNWKKKLNRAGGRDSPLPKQLITKAFSKPFDQNLTATFLDKYETIEQFKQPPYLYVDRKKEKVQFSSTMRRSPSFESLKE